MPELKRIFRIPESVSVKIAAGEVIERPASVIKELVENSIDAGSDSIVVEITSGGKRSIKIRDNGCGIPQDELALSIERFTTSKLKMTDTLLEDIDTLGFRGEALASIASVSRMTMTTRTENDDAASVIHVEGGRVVREDRTASPLGTTVEVDNIFYNFPARRKFLKSEKTEAGHIETLFSRLALPYFDIGFSLFSDGKKIVEYKKGERFKERAMAIFPKEALPSVEISGRAGGYTLEGVITPQGVDFATSSSILIYVNGRVIRDKVITHAFCEALRTHISGGRYPGGILYFRLPSNDVDVNVHPAKSEVRFRDSNLVHNFIARAIASSLEKDSTGSAFADDARPANRKDAYFPFSGLRTKGTVPQSAAVSFRFARDDRRGASPPGHYHEVVALEQSHKAGYFSNLAIIGQAKDSYIVCSDGDGIVIIDQHAAHERVTFEELRKSYGQGTIRSQNLLFPVQFELKGEKAQLLSKERELLLRLGFVIEEFGRDSFILRGVPEMLAGTDCVKTITDMIDLLADFSKEPSLQAKIDEMLETIACHSSVRFSKPLAREEIVSLFNGLDELKDSKTCPHGRPFLVTLSESELRKMFKRI